MYISPLGNHTLTDFGMAVSYLYTWDYYSLASPTAQWNILSSVNHLINEKLNSKFSEVFEGLKFMNKISEHMKQLRVLWTDSRGSKMEH